MAVKNSFAFVALVSFCICCCFGQELNPRGRNVCKPPGSPGLTCCSGWGRHGDECLTPLCEGNFTCKENEVCVRPNECRCRHGYFGASCDTKCPAQFWGPDCKGKCSCYPNGQCDDLTGKCTCNHNRWGANCENACLCNKGKCDQDTGKCTCHPGFWGPQCNNNCYCSQNSVCDAATGRCLCSPGWTGRNCAMQCNCNNSPCDQFTGRCQCRERLWGQRCERYCQCVQGKCNQADGSCTCTPGYRGKFCREPCPAGFYGQNCRNRCGHCKGQQPCKVTEGRCITCDRGWNGTRCDQLCSKGFFGDNCQDECPACKDGHHCDPIHGKCSHCNPGWIGDRCEVRCPNGTYGENCESDCSQCFNGGCHLITGECLCDPGFHGVYCNMTCPPGQFGVNCNQTCSCHNNNCDAVSGACNLQPNQRVGVMAAGTLVGCLLVGLLSLLCCCCLCRHKDHNKKAQWILCGRFSRISTKLPRIPLRRQKLPKVVVAHHDPEENTFNCSFIEPPPAADQEPPPPSSWSSQESFSSFSGDEGPVYCVPHEESVRESGDQGAPSPALPDQGDAGEYTSLKDTSVSKQALLKSSDSEGSTSGSEAAGGALYARIARLSKTSKEEDAGARDGDAAPVPEAKRNGKPPPSPGKPKPRPPDPSTKPKVSWIHGNAPGSPQPEPQGQHPQQGGGKALAVPKEKKRSSSDGSAKSEERQRMKDLAKEKSREQQKNQETKETEAVSPSARTKPQRGSRSGDEPASPGHMDHINGVVQNALKKISGFHSSSSEKKETPKEAPKEPPKSPKVLHPHMNSEAATLLAAQLKEKTQSINRNEGTGLTKTNGLSATPKAYREKPTPPQKAKRTSSSGAGQQACTKPLLPSSSSLQKLGVPGAPDPGTTDAKSPDKQDLNGSKAAEPTLEPTPKKTPMKKPPRKKGKEGTLDTSDTKTPPPKTAIMPPQIVK